MRPISSEGSYARALFPHMDPRNACRMLKRAGGAAKLMACSLEARALLLGIPSEDLKMLSLRSEDEAVPPITPTREPEADKPYKSRWVCTCGHSRFYCDCPRPTRAPEAHG